MTDRLWHMSAYYPNFSCKADKCRHCCCSSWRIPVSRQEYEKLNNTECSDELYSRITRSFEEPEIITDDCFRYICFNWLNQCPIQEKGLCAIHREKGESFLPKICRLYPRSLKNICGHNIASCSSSCEAVLEYLYDHDEMNVIEKMMDTEAEIAYDIDPDEIKQITLFQKIIRNRDTTLAESIRDVCMIVNEKEFVKDYNSDEDPLKAMIALLGRFRHTNERFEETVAPIIERYDGDPSLYKEDTVKFENDRLDWMSFFERIINNSIIYENFPFVDRRADRTSSYKGLCVCYGMMRVIAIGNHYFHPDKDSYIDALSALFHLIDHTAFYYNITVMIDNAAIMLKL